MIFWRANNSLLKTTTRTLDLHGLTVRQAMDKFVECANECVSSGKRVRVEVIHGWGSSGSGGAILRELRRFVQRHSDCFESVVEGEGLGNPGVTIVYPKRVLPRALAGHGNEAENAICEYCRTPKSLQKIESKLQGKFRAAEIRAAVRALVAKSRLREVRCEGKVLYEAA